MPRGKVADVQRNARKTPDLGHLPLGDEAIGDSALIENFDGAGVESACPGADSRVVRAPLDNGDVDARQGQFARQHHAGRTGSGNHHGVFIHRHTPPVLRARLGLGPFEICSRHYLTMKLMNEIVKTV
jgi:hypothetical protein